jgi:hypothetical protein
MRYWAGQCDFDDMKFEVMAHTLRVYRPDQKCPGPDQPQVDFSQAAAAWSFAFTDVSVPSQHTVGGKRFAAEMILSHAYTGKKNGKRVSNIAALYHERALTSSTDWEHCNPA